MKNNAKTSTKEKILNESLRLFAKKGYSAVGVAEIADAVGIKAPSLYKHFTGKKAIFDAIIERVNNADAEYAGDYEMPSEPKENGNEEYKNIDSEKIKEYTKAMLLHWTEEEFYCNFRRMLTVEQYNSAENARLYAQYISVGPLEYMADIFEETADNRQTAQAMALKFYAPMFFLYSMYDDETVNDEDKKSDAKNKILALLDKHIDDFFASFGR